MSTARESEMCYSLGTSVGDVTRLNVANVVRFSLYIQLIWKFLIVDIFVDNCEESCVSCKRKIITIYNQSRQCEKV